MPRTHEPECVEERKKELLRWKWWVERFPQYCSFCQGKGFFDEPGSYDNPPNFEWCYHCVGEGECPQCGESLLQVDLDHDVQCRLCGWQSENKLCTGAPYVREDYDCSCPYVEV